MKIARKVFKIKIESGIPVEGFICGTITPKLREMKVGDSFKCLPHMRYYLSTLAKRAGIKITTRKVDDSNIRVWRIK